MNEEIIADLKQFIAATVRQEGASFKSDLRGEFKDFKNDLLEEFSDFKNDIRSEIKVLSTKLDDIDAKLDTVIEATGEQFEDHDQRITKLEAKAA